MRTIEISTEFIKLQQLLKLLRLQLQLYRLHERGKKIREGDIVEVEGEEDLTVKVNGEI